MKPTDKFSHFSSFLPTKYCKMRKNWLKRHFLPSSFKLWQKRQHNVFADNSMLRKHFNIRKTGRHIQGNFLKAYSDERSRGDMEIP